MNWLLNLMHCQKCLLCGEFLIDREAEICESCRKAIIPLYGVPIFPLVAKMGKRGGRYFDYAYSCYNYKGSVRFGIIACKFRGRKKAYEYFAKDMVRLFRGTPRLCSAEVIIPVPLSRLRKIKRGFNQCEILTDYMENQLNLTQYKDVLIRKRHSATQSKAESVRERLKNVKDAYIVKHGEKILGKTVLLVDDVITTGSTVNECAKVLIKAGAARVFCISIAKA